MSQWENPPPVVVLSGDDDFLRSRELKEAVSVSDAIGRSVEYLDGADHDGLSTLLSSSGVFFKEDLLVVVESPEKVDSNIVLRHFNSGQSDVVVVLHKKGVLKKKEKSGLATVVASIPDRFVARFEKPKPWEEEDRAVGFCLQESRKNKIELSERLALALVRNVGKDLGILSFEIAKLARYLQASGDREVSVDHIKKTLGAFSDLGPKPIVDALEKFDRKKTAKAFANMRRTHAGALSGATLKATAFISNAATRWLHVASLLKEGAELQEIATRVGVHPFVVRNSLLPVAKRWGKDRLVQLIRSVALVERSVRSGYAHPWVYLESIVLESMSNNGAKKT